MIKKDSESTPKETKQKPISEPTLEEKLKADNKNLTAKIEALTEEISTARDKSLRILADSENAKKMHKIQLDKEKKYALFNFASDLVEFVENFYLLKSHKPKAEESSEIKSFFQGFDISLKELLKLLEKFNITRIAPETGDEFDHDVHEAIARAETNDKNLDGTIKTLIKAGYSINDRIIKAALVETYFYKEAQ